MANILKNNLAQRVLVTGGAGFIGSATVNVLKTKGYDVVIADNLSKHASKTRNDVKFINTDLTKKENAEKAMSGIDYVIHLAAKIGGIGYFHKYPATIISENNQLNSAIFNAAVKNKIKRIVYISSSMVFENTNRYPSCEEDVKNIPPPTSAYGFSKLSGEKYCEAYHDEYGLNYTIIRPFNAYGINERPGTEIGYAHVIPDLIKKMLQGQYPLELLGDGKQTRCFTHVSDIAEGIIAAMEKKEGENNDFNISNEEEIQIIDLAKKLWELLKIEKPFKVKFTKSFKYDVRKRVPSVKKARDILGWQAKVKLEQGLKEVISWLKEEYEKKTLVEDV